MTEASLLIALAVSVVLNVCLAVLLFKVAAKTADALDSAHERTTRHTEGLVDRIVSGDWQTYKAYELLEEAPSADPQPEPEVPQFTDGPDKGGFASRLGLKALTERRQVGEEGRVRASEELLESDMVGR